MAEGIKGVLMEIRKTKQEEIDILLQIYAGAREFMARTGNPNQWCGGYPSREQLCRDIADGISYVAVEDGEIEATFVYFHGEDPTYRIIEDGSWLNDNPYGVIHRIASRGRVKGAGAQCILWGFAQCGNLRMDTHKDNKVMQHVLEKNGFVKCGRIYLADGRPRIAYQKSGIL